MPGKTEAAAAAAMADLSIACLREAFEALQLDNAEKAGQVAVLKAEIKAEKAAAEEQRGIIAEQAARIEELQLQVQEAAAGAEEREAAREQFAAAVRRGLVTNRILAEHEPGSLNKHQLGQLKANLRNNGCEINIKLSSNGHVRYNMAERHRTMQRLLVAWLVGNGWGEVVGALHAPAPLAGAA